MGRSHCSQLSVIKFIYIYNYAYISILDIYIVFVIVIFVINTYPILACVQAPIPILGYALGAMYTDIK